MRNLLKFLKESNALEYVYDDQSLTDAKKAWDFLIVKDNLQVKDILEAHKILMENQPCFESWKGHFRQGAVMIGTSRLGKPEYAIPSIMMNWVRQNPDWTTKNDIKMAHIIFEDCHPFNDGNGRLGRILMNWQRVKMGFTILVIHRNRKDRYLLWFKK